MKNSITKFAVFSMLATASMFEGVQAGDCYTMYDNNDCCSDWSFAFENVIVRPYFSRNNAYFFEDPPDVSGQIAKQFAWDFQYTPRFELGWNSNCGYGARARYWRFSGKEKVHVTDVNGDIASFFSEDSSDQNIGFDGSTDAEFSHRLKVNVLDLEATFEKCNWLYSAGLRYATFDQHYKGENLVGGLEVMKSKHDFSGWGLTMALEYMQPIKCGFSLFTKARGSLLYGNSKWSAYNPDPTATDYLASKNKRDLQAVTELQLGVDWRTCFCDDRVLFVRVSGEAQYWANGGAAGPGNNAIYDEGNYQNTHPQDSSLGFVGINVTVGVEF